MLDFPPHRAGPARAAASGVLPCNSMHGYIKVLVICTVIIDVMCTLQIIWHLPRFKILFLDMIDNLACFKSYLLIFSP